LWIAQVKTMASRCPLVGLAASMILLAGAGAGAGVADDTCYCRTASGARVAVGGTACLKTNGGMQEARCGFLLNNPSWKFTGRPCPQASREGQPRSREAFASASR
jgi:hypothetical protein